MTVMERLIDNVHKYPCLWNTEAPEYKLLDMKDAAWREVVKDCGIPDVKEAKALWRKLRDGHRQAIAKKKATLGQGAIPRSTWKYEKRMAFLLPSMKKRIRTSTVEIQEPRSQENKDVAHEQNDETQQNEDPSEPCVFVPPQKITVVPLLEKEPQLRPIRTIQEDALKKQTVAESTSQDHALEKFFMSMLLTTSQLPERLKLRVQRQIFNTVMEAKEESLMSQSSSSASPSTTHTYHMPIQSPKPTGIDSPHSYSSSSNYSYVHTQTLSSPQQTEFIKSECYENQMFE